jgi:hypothetical protein
MKKTSKTSKMSNMYNTSDISKIAILPDERYVQALDGGAQFVHVPAQHASSGEKD